MSSYQDFKSFYQSNILLFIILLFVIIYIIINWTIVSNGKYFGGQYTKPILITGIIFLIIHMLITWDDDSTNDNLTNDNLTNNNPTNNNPTNNNPTMDDKIINIPKYKFQNNINNNQIKNEIIAASTLPKPIYEIEPQPFQQTQSLNTKYKIVKNNDINQNHQANFINFSNNHSNDDSKLSNRNIFISHKNSSKYGLKF
jgi:hypothetical protein